MWGFGRYLKFLGWEKTNAMETYRRRCSQSCYLGGVHLARPSVFIVYKNGKVVS